MKFISKILYFLSFGFILVYFFIILKDALNYPIWDDFDLYLNNLNDAINSTSFWTHIWYQHNEHRLIIPKLINYMIYSISGNVNFYILIIIGNLFLFSVLWVLSTQLKITKSLWVLLFTFCILGFTDFENKLWATGSLQNYGILLFSFLAIYFANKEHAKFSVVAFLFSILASFTSGNGMFVFIVVGLMYIIYQRKYVIGVFFMLCFVLTYHFYFKNYLVSPQKIDSIYVLTSMFWKWIQYIFVFIGNPFWIYSYKLSITTMIGVLIFSSSIVAIYKNYKTEKVLVAILIFIYLSIFAASLSRINFGVIQATSARYSILSSILLVITIYLVFKNSKLQVQSIVVLIFVGLQFYPFFHGAKLMHRKSKMVLDSYYCYGLDINRLSIVYPAGFVAKETLDKMEQNNIYILPPMEPRVCK